MKCLGAGKSRARGGLTRRLSAILISKTGIAAV
jgi:hypothetical protein